MNAKKLLFIVVALAVMTALTSCGATPEVVREVVKETVVVEKEVEKEVEKIVTEVVEVEKEVVKEVEKEVEVVITATPDPSIVKLGGTLVYVLNQEGATLDPGAIFYAVDSMVAYQIYDQLVWLDENLDVQPGLAKSWTVSDGYDVYDFELRDDVTFHDGEPFNADAVIAWFERIQDPDFPIGGINRWLEPVDTIEKTGDYSVRFTLKEPNLMWLRSVANRLSGIGSPKAAEEWGDEYGTHPVGSGPFKFVEWLPGSHIKLEKNTDYNWASPMFGHSGPAYLDEVIFQFIGEAATRGAALEAGDADVAARVPWGDAGRLNETPGLDMISSVILGVPQYNGLNVQKPPTDDILVRKAILHATDKAGIVETVFFGLTEPAYGPVTQYDPAAFNTELKNMYPYDLEKAGALLEEAGWVDSDGDGIRDKDGENLFVILSGNEGWIEWLQYLQANLREAGFDSQIDRLAGAAYTEYGKNCEANVPGMGGVSWDPLDLKTHFGAKAPVNWACIDDPTLDQMILDAEQTLDPDERNQIIKDIQTYMMEQAYELPIVELVFNTGTQDNVKGIRFEPSGFYPWLYDAYKLPGTE